MHNSSCQFQAKGSCHLHTYLQQSFLQNACAWSTRQAIVLNSTNNIEIGIDKPVQEIWCSSEAYEKQSAVADALAFLNEVESSIASIGSAVARRNMQRLVDEDTEVLWAIKVAARLPLGVFSAAKHGVHEMCRYTLHSFNPPCLGSPPQLDAQGLSSSNAHRVANNPCQSLS